jgi:hypothetical protein
VPGQPLFGGIAVHATGLVCLPLCDSLLKAGAGCVSWRVKNLKRLFRGLQVFETKRGFFFGWGGLPRWIKPP